MCMKIQEFAEYIMSESANQYEDLTLRKHIKIGHEHVNKHWDNDNSDYSHEHTPAPRKSIVYVTRCFFIKTK